MIAVLELGAHLHWRARAFGWLPRFVGSTHTYGQAYSAASCPRLVPPPRLCFSDCWQPSFVGSPSMGRDSYTGGGGAFDHSTASSAAGGPASSATAGPAASGAGHLDDSIATSVATLVRAHTPCARTARCVRPCVPVRERPGGRA
jgi:hypothetical protein